MKTMLYCDLRNNKTPPTPPPPPPSAGDRLLASWG